MTHCPSNLSDKHSPLSVSIPSLSPSINGGGGGGGGTSSGQGDHYQLGLPTSESVLTLSPGVGEPAHDFLNGAQDIISLLTSSLRTLNHERERLKLVIETVAETASISSRSGAVNTAIQPNVVASLRCALQVAVQQNVELRARLQKIRSEAEVAVEGPSLAASLELDLNASQRFGTHHHSLSYSSSCVSQSEFFDAKEYLTDVAHGSDSSSDASETEIEGEADEGSVSEASEMGNEANHDRGKKLSFFNI